MLELRKICENIGVEVCNVDVRLLSNIDFSQIEAAWIDSAILLIRGQNMEPEDHIRLMRRFGTIMNYTNSKDEQFKFPEILRVTNLQRDGKPLGSPAAGRMWHTDGHYLESPPAASMLYAIEVPPVGGDTWFANMFAAYEALPEAVQKRIAGLQVVISRTQSLPYNHPERTPPPPEKLATWKDMPHPIVRTHPVSGRKALNVGGNVPWRIVGMPDDESAELVTYLQDFAIQPQFTYCHQWRKGDIVLWDNRSALHRATPYNQSEHVRIMHRITIQGDRPC